MTDLRLTRKEFLHLSMGAAALTITGCPADDTGGDSTTGDGTTGTGGPTTAPTGSSTSPSTTATTDETSTGEPGTSTGEETTGSTGTPDTTSGSESGSSGGSGSGSGSSEAAADCSNGAFDTMISGNHGHAVSIPAGMLVAGTPLNGIDITGAAGHAHTIDLSADDVDALLAGESVTVDASFNMHPHMVTVSC